MAKLVQLAAASCFLAFGQGSEEACSYVPDTDYSCTWGGDAKAGSKEDCCSACSLHAY
eukprot:SAG22_NODE_1008_length_6054_cov_11.023678_5_plen_58_part_00